MGRTIPAGDCCDCEPTDPDNGPCSIAIELSGGGPAFMYMQLDDKVVVHAGAPNAHGGGYDHSNVIWQVEGRITSDDIADLTHPESSFYYALGEVRSFRVWFSIRPDMSLDMDDYTTGNFAAGFGGSGATVNGVNYPVGVNINVPMIIDDTVVVMDEALAPAWPGGRTFTVSCPDEEILPLMQSPTCVHRSLTPLFKEKCPTCKSKKQFPAYWCNLLNVLCSETNKLPYRKCHECDKWEPKNA